MTHSHPESGGTTLLICGVPVDDVTMDETLDRVWDLARRGRHHGRSFQVATVNVDFVVNALADADIDRILRSTALSIPDGMPLVWGSRVLGGTLRTRVAGADLVPLMCARAAEDGTRIALIGAAPGVAQRAGALLRDRCPGLDVVATPGPTFHDLDEVTAADLDELRALGADIGCVAFGHPKQDAFIDRFGDELGIPVMIGVGGSLDFLVGEQRRAPAWMQRVGLEWLHRAASEPRRLAGRYARDLRVFAPALLRQAWSGRHTATAGDVRVTALDDAVTIDFTDVATLTNRAAHLVATAVRTAARHGRRVEFAGFANVDLSRVRGVDSFVSGH